MGFKFKNIIKILQLWDLKRFDLLGLKAICCHNRNVFYSFHFKTFEKEKNDKFDVIKLLTFLLWYPFTLVRAMIVCRYPKEKQFKFIFISNRTKNKALWPTLQKLCNKRGISKENEKNIVLWWWNNDEKKCTKKRNWKN